MIEDPFDLGLGPGDRDPIIIRVKEKLGVFPITDEYTDDLAARVRGWRKVQGESPDDIYLDSTTLAELGL